MIKFCFDYGVRVINNYVVLMIMENNGKFIFCFRINKCFVLVLNGNPYFYRCNNKIITPFFFILKRCLTLI